MLSVHALGGLSVYRPCSGLIPIAGSCRLVLGYLLTHRHRRVSRVELAESLWADHDAIHARRCLSTALWRLHKSAGSGLSLLTFQDGDEVSLNWDAKMWVDSVAMELRMQPLLHRKPETLTRNELERLTRGVRLYRGDYLIGIDHEWAWLERQRLRDLYCDALHHLTLAYAAAHDWSYVLEWGRRLSREEPLREDGHRMLMRAYAHTGNRAKAIAQYQECLRLLRRELDVEPMTETQALYRELLQGACYGSNIEPPTLANVHRRIARVRRALASSQQQLDKALDSLVEASPPQIND